MRISSESYDRTAVEPIVQTLRGLIGNGRDKVSVYVADGEEIARMCGPGTMSCYDSYSDEITISGTDGSIAGIPRDYALAHEYGHHLANQSRGSLWLPLASGTMRWATHERICELARSRQVFPGNEGAHYWENPGEAFAQSYAQLNFPDTAVAWSYSPLLEPDAGSLAALRADIHHPWKGPRRTRWNVGSRRQGIGSASFWRRFRTPLDGKVIVSVHARPGSRLRIELKDRASGRVVSKTRQAGKSRIARLRYPNCGSRALEIKIENPRQAPFRVQLTRP